MHQAKQQFLKKFGARIQQMRRQAGISQEELAHRAKLHRTYMGRIERGESNPPVYTVYKIAKILKMDSSDILL
jgi:transcriptional regulator with XRE-family HTH domain